METRILNCKFICFFEIMVGCAEMGFKIDPIFLDWVHPVLGFYFILKIPRLFDDRVCNVCCLNLGVRGSSKVSIF